MITPRQTYYAAALQGLLKNSNALRECAKAAVKAGDAMVEQERKSKEARAAAAIRRQAEELEKKFDIYIGGKTGDMTLTGGIGIGQMENDMNIDIAVISLIHQPGFERITYNKKDGTSFMIYPAGERGK